MNKDRLKVYPIVLPFKDHIRYSRGLITYQCGNYGINYEGNICITEDNKNFWSQHLYLISDEKIVDQDWTLITYSNLKGYKGPFTGPLRWDINAKTETGEFKKIIATTDKSFGLPLIPEEWIRDEWVSSQGKIDSVYLQMDSCCIDAGYNCICDHRDEPNWQGQWRVKVTTASQVIILPVQETFTKGDMLAAWLNSNGGTIEFNEWFNQRY